MERLTRETVSGNFNEVSTILDSQSDKERNHTEVQIGKWNKGATKVGITKCECYGQNGPIFYVNLVHEQFYKFCKQKRCAIFLDGK